VSTIDQDLDVPAGTAHPAVAPGNAEVTSARLLYLPTERDSVAITARGGARLFLLGGEPLGETLLMWWNFVGRTPADIADAARDWARGERFGAVHGYRGAPLPAPPLDPARLARRA
jgi:quercetin 2,3-dioxygenase